MKLLCAGCDEPMRVQNAASPEGGCLAVTFTCAKCGNRVALLTNPGETQLVKALDVEIGGRRRPSGPFERVRGSLARQRLDAFGPRPGDAGAGVVWTEEATRRLEKVPAIAREMARNAIERFALAEGCRQVTPEVMDRARERSGG